MKQTDLVEFSEAIASFFFEYGIELKNCPGRLDVWWGALEAYPIEDIKHAMVLHLKDPDAGMYKPTVAHLINHLDRTIPEAKKRARNALRREYISLRHEIEAKQSMLSNDRRHGIIKDEDYQNGMYALAKEMSDLNSNPRFAPILHQLTRDS